MNYVVYDAHHGMTHLKPKPIVCWQGSHSELRKRYPEFFVGRPDVEMYFGHAIEVNKTTRTITLFAFDCQAFVYDREWNNRYPEAYHGADDVVVIKSWRVPKNESLDSKLEEARKYVDACLERAVPFWEAIKTQPLVPLTIRITGPEEQQVRKLALQYDVTPAIVMQCLLETEDAQAALDRCGYVRQALHPSEVNPPKQKAKVKV